MRIQASLLLSIILLSGLQAIAQETNIAAPLSMEISPERAWWDLQHYTLKVHVDPDSKSIAGSNQVRFKVVSAGTHKMQIDLQEPMQRSEEHTSELQSRGHLVCRLLLEKKKKNIYKNYLH